MNSDLHRYGQSGEDLAVRFLQAQGYKIIDRNYRTPMGEIDIIAEHKGAVVFVEVKARRSKGYGSPKLALTPAKRRKLSMTALAYLKNRGSTQTKARFDVVTVQHEEGRPHVEVIANAFELAYP
ncbi:MAG: YraN family protein [Desulfobacteraceae bacterium]|nr:MAG: YraN family protein [Desulfobacteraceae bacterium]